MPYVDEGGGCLAWRRVGGLVSVGTRRDSTACCLLKEQREGGEKSKKTY